MIVKQRVAVAFWFASFLALFPLSSVAQTSLPNIVVILVDDLGYGDLSCYGAKDLRSPHVDQLVSRGLRFDQFYANCPVCSPTRASLLTGRYPELVGVPGVIRTHPENSWGYLAQDATTLPTALKTVGYDTAIVGKWHLGLESPNRPEERGFDHVEAYLGDMMDDYYSHRRHNINYMVRGNKTIDPAGHATDLFTDWACQYLNHRRESSRPFFLYLAYNAPHTPIQPPEDWLAKVKQREPEISEARAKLVALIEHLDHGIGQVMQTLNKLPFADNTIVVFTSDNGGQLNVGANNGVLRDGKQSMYEGGLKVPAAVVWPNQIQSGRRTNQPVLTMDLYPTLCEIAGINLASQHVPVDGISIRPLLAGEPQETSDRDLFFHRREGGDRYGGLVINAVRRGNWKLLQNSPFAPLELYNLADDPLEQHDLAESQRDIFRSLSTALRWQVQRGGAVPWLAPDRRDALPENN